MTRKKKIDRTDEVADAQSAASRQLSKSSDRASHTAALTPSAGNETTDDVEHKPRADKTTAFPDLPLEIRIMIYNMVLSTEGNVYEITHASSTPGVISEWRDNFHKVTNIGPHHLALSAVNKQIREDIKANLPDKDFRFVGTWALASFLFKSGTVRPSAVRLDLLEKASKVEVTLGSEPSPHFIKYHWKPLEWMTWRLIKPLAVEFVPAEGGHEKMRVVCAEVARKWKSHMEWVEYKRAQAEGR